MDHKPPEQYRQIVSKQKSADPAKRHFYITFVSVAATFIVLSGCSARVDQKDFESLYRSGKAIAGATGVGVNYPKFSELVQAFASEVSIGVDRANNKPEKAMIENYMKALEAYKDSLTVWKHSVDSPSDEITVEGELVPIVSRYALQTQSKQTEAFYHDSSIEGVPDIDIPARRYETIERSSIQEIWVKADRYLSKANAEYSGATNP